MTAAALHIKNTLIRIHGPKAWTFLLCAFTVAIALPLLGWLPAHMVPLVGKFLCYGMVALAMDLVWGFAGILSLGHGLFFALGGYAMGMNLMRSMKGEGVYRSELPDFMVFLDWKTLPITWYGFDSFPFAVFMAMAVPGTLALIFGFLTFRSKIKGVYLSIVTQALTYAAMLLFFQNATGFGGNNGLTDFKRIAGFSLQDPNTKVGLYIASAVALLATYVLARYVVTSRLGRVLVAVRDAELKARFCGYESTHYKLFVWTLSACMCGLAGALYVPQVGIINPSEMQPSNSIEMAIWVAVGGRGTLSGAVLGAWIVNGGKSWLTGAFPEVWLFALGGLFVLVTLFLPGGISSLLSRVGKPWQKLRAAKGRSPTPTSPVVSPVSPEANT